ncbi:MAG: hypothetical protein ABI780_12015 [Ardenticatenales bacterium]
MTDPIILNPATIEAIRSWSDAVKMALDQLISLGAVLTSLPIPVDAPSRQPWAPRRRLRKVCRR